MADAHDNRTSWWGTTLKLGATATAIAAVAFGVAVLDVSAPGSVSHADITWLSGGFEQTNTEQFDEALQDLGHDEPRRYEMDGNTVFFSTTTSRKAPRQLMVDYQRELKRRGLNDRVYRRLDPDAEIERTETALTGGLIPLAISADHVALAGAVTDNRADDPDELLDNHDGVDEVSELLRGHRYIEMSRQPGSRHTSVVASWSDEAFDYSTLMSGDPAERPGYDDAVPACPGCQRLTRFADDNREETDRVELAYLGPRSIPETRTFYHRVLPRRGWNQKESQPGQPLKRWLDDTGLVDGQTDRWTRRGADLKLTFTTDPATGDTLTIASRTPEGS